MTVQFTTTSKKDFRTPEAPPKFYALAKSIGRADKDRISTLVARMSSMSSTDSIGMMEAFLTIVPDELAEGRIVELGDFGSFRIGLSSEGSETPEEVTADKITGARVIFTPGRRFKEVLNNLRYQKEGNE